MAKGEKINYGDLLSGFQGGMSSNYLMQGVGNITSGNTKQGLYNLGAAALAKANPYAAGVMALTGGKSISQLLGKRKRPTVTGAQNQAELARAQQIEGDRNRMLEMASRSRAEADRFKEQQNAYRNQIRNVREKGIAARELAGYLGGTATQTAAAGQAAMANLRANLARRGMGPSSGIGVGAEAALAGQIAGQQGAAIGNLNRAAMDRAMMGEQQLFAADTAAREAALGREMQMSGMASDLALRQQAFAEQQRLAQEARDQAMYQRRFGESQALGQGLMGAYGLYLQSRKPQTTATTTGTTTRAVEPTGTAPLPPASIASMSLNLPSFVNPSEFLTQQYPNATPGQAADFRGRAYVFTGFGWTPQSIGGF